MPSDATASQAHDLSFLFEPRLCDPRRRTPFLLRNLRYVKLDRRSDVNRGSRMLLLRVAARDFPALTILRIWLVAITRAGSGISYLALGVRDVYWTGLLCRCNSAMSCKCAGTLPRVAFDLDVAENLPQDTSLALRFEIFPSNARSLTRNKPLKVGTIELTNAANTFAAKSQQFHVTLRQIDDLYKQPDCCIPSTYLRFHPQWPDGVLDGFLDDDHSNGSVSLELDQLSLVNNPDSTKDTREVRMASFCVLNSCASESNPVPHDRSSGTHMDDSFISNITVALRVVPHSDRVNPCCLGKSKVVQIFHIDISTSTNIFVRFDFVCPLCLRNCHRGPTLRTHFDIDHSEFCWSSEIAKVEGSKCGTEAPIRTVYIVRRFTLLPVKKRLKVDVPSPRENPRFFPRRNPVLEAGGNTSKHLQCKESEDSGILNLFKGNSMRFPDRSGYVHQFSSRSRKLMNRSFESELPSQLIYINVERYVSWMGYLRNSMRNEHAQDQLDLITEPNKIATGTGLEPTSKRSVSSERVCCDRGCETSELASISTSDDNAPILRIPHIRPVRICKDPPLVPARSSRSCPTLSRSSITRLEKQDLYHVASLAPVEKRHITDFDYDSEEDFDHSWRLQMSEEELLALLVHPKKKVLWSLWNQFAFQRYAAGEYAERYTRYSLEIFALQYGCDIKRLGLRVDLLAFLRSLSIHGCIDATAILSIMKCLAGDKNMNQCVESKYPRGINCDGANTSYNRSCKKGHKRKIKNRRPRAVTQLLSQ